MGIIRNIKSDYEIYENQKLECLVAISFDDCKQIKKYFKTYKGKKIQPKEMITGYKMVMDEEYNSLKIDFSETFNFDIKDLTKA